MRSRTSKGHQKREGPRDGPGSQAGRESERQRERDGRNMALKKGSIITCTIYDLGKQAALVGETLIDTHPSPRRQKLPRKWPYLNSKSIGHFPPLLGICRLQCLPKNVDFWHKDFHQDSLQRKAGPCDPCKIIGFEFRGRINCLLRIYVD